jgi:dolichol-phosphate mannosyltransferase
MIVPEIFSKIPEKVDILVIDDNSPDKTAVKVKELMLNNKERLFLLERPEKSGLASAYINGFKWGINKGYSYFLEMDADFSHDPGYIQPMLEKIEDYDVVIGSRNIKGGGVEGWSPVRNFISKGGSLYSRIILGCPIKDLTGGFNLWRKDTLDKIDLDSIISTGYSFQIEMKYKAYKAGCCYVELPIIFKDRTRGKSKMSKGIFFGALANVWRLRFKNIDLFLKFFITGGLGTITNLVIFFILVDMNNIPGTAASILCFIIAASQNYIVNHCWSFKKTTKDIKPSWRKWGQFLLGSALGLTLNVLALNLILYFFTLPFKFIAQGIGIAAGMVVNYLISKKFIFKTGKNE